MKIVYYLNLICLLFVFSNCKSQTINSIDDQVAPEYLKADFREITSNIERKVPNPFYLCPKSSYDSVKQKIEESLNRPMTVIEFYQKVSPIFMQMKDGHVQFFTDLKLLEALEQKNPDLYFPFTVFIDKDRIFIDQCLGEGSAAKRGDEVLTINNVPAKLILSKLRYGVALKSNEENFFERKLEDHFSRSLVLELGFRNNFNLKFANRSVNVQGVSSKIIDALYDAKSDFAYQVLDKKSKIGYLVLNTLSTEKRAKFDSVLAVFFKTLKEQHINKLIVDLRGNLGGSTKLGRDVFDYITDKKYAMAIGEEYLRHSKKVSDMDTALTVPKQPADKFSGKTILLTDVTSYSSSHMMANAFKYYKMGIVVGQISAEPLFISGEVQLANTSNTKCRVYYPTSNFYLSGYQKDSVTYFVPDYQIYPTTKDRVNGKDRAMDLAVKLLNSGR